MANVIVVGAHPDDQEIGMGGTIALLAQQGHSVLILDMTDGCPTPRGDRATRLAEARSAMDALQPERMPPGKPISRVLLDLKNREVEHTLAARHMLAGAIRAHQANVLFLPHPVDAHPDHIAVTRIGEDARFDAKLSKVSMPVPAGMREGAPIYPAWVFYYYCSHLRAVPDPVFFFDTTSYTQQKVRAVRAYESQFGVGTSPLNASLPALLANQDAYMGSRIGVGAAEGFWCKEPLGLTSLASLAGLAP